MTLPTKTQAAVTVVIAERERQLEKYPPEHDVSMGIHHLIDEAISRTHRGAAGCGYYHKSDIVEAAAMLLAAVEAMDHVESEPGAHDWRGCERRGKR